MLKRADGRRDVDRPVSDVLDGTQRTGPELMALQIEIMTRIHEVQVRQRELLEAMHVTQERWVASNEPEPIDDATLRSEPVHPAPQVPVRLLGSLMLRVTLAAMPAMVLIGLIWLATMLGLIAILARFGVLGGGGPF